MPKLVEKQNAQYRIGSPLLLFFSAPFIVWQMGVLFFSGTAMSLFGRTPISIPQDGATSVIAAGYAVSILALCFFPRKSVWMERISLPIAFIAEALMLLPFPPGVIIALFYISAFVCVFSTGVMISIAAHHFTLDTVWRDGVISMAIGGVAIAVLQNDFFTISPTVFTISSVLLTGMQAAFYFIIPADIQARYTGHENKQKMPGILFVGIWLVIGFATLLICFASSYAESVENGVSMLYLSAAAIAALAFALGKKLGWRALRVFGGFFAAAVFGFALAFLSVRVPALQPAACIFLGFIVVLANLWMFFAAASFRVYATRFIGAIGAGVGMALALTHAGLLELLRNDTALLYGVYAALSAALLLIYHLIEPYFAYSFSAKQPAAPPAPREEPAAPATCARAETPGPFGALSEQERILAGLILEGHTETSAAKLMNITLNTQKGYRRNLYTKLGIHSKRELFGLAAKKQ